MDWKKKIDVLGEQQQRRKEEADKIRAAKSEKKQTEDWTRQLAEYQDKFKCSVCEKPSYPQYDEPREESMRGCPVTVGGGTDWNRPYDLWQCNICHKWTCQAHIYRGVCKNCADKL